MKMKMLQFAVVLISLWSSAAQAGDSQNNNNSVNSILTGIMEELNKLKKENQALKTEIEASKQELNSAVSLFLSQTSALESKINSAASKQELQSVLKQVKKLDQKIKMPKVAFSATLSNVESGYKFISSSSELTLIYKNAFTNIGYAYNPHTGVFTAPVRGLYFFSFTVFNPFDYSTSSAQQVSTGVSLMKNGAHIVSVTDNAPGVDTEDSGAGSASLVLEKGDQVYLMLWKNCRIYTDKNNRNSFSGHLVFTM